MQNRMNRRKFLRWSSFVAAGSILSACGPKPTQPAQVADTVAAPTDAATVTQAAAAVNATPVALTYSEAPTLADRVKSGELPAVENRLPVKEDLIVIQPFEEVGQYGGTVHLVGDEGSLKMFVAYDTPVRVNPDYTAYEANLFKGIEPSADGKTFTVTMREGLKWSDGEPFTTEDIKFWWEDLAVNEDYDVITPPWWGFKNDQPMTVTIVDDYTWTFQIAEPDFAMVRNVLAVGFWEWENLMKPKHYLKQFHPTYNPEATWEQLTEKDNYIVNPDYPTIFAWHTVEYKAGESYTLERNPYYWKVDTVGNQLPYIDRVDYKIVDDGDVRLLQIASGQVDGDWRGAYNPRNVALLRDKAEAGNFRVLLYSDALVGYPALEANQNHTEDPYIGELLRTTDFLRALSVSIDRDRVNEVVWNGLATPSQGTTVSNPAWQFTDDTGEQLLTQWSQAYAQFDVEQANKLFDGLGLDKRDAEGFRTRKDGTKFELIIDVTGWGGQDITIPTAEAVKPMFEQVGLRVILNPTYGTPDETLRWEEGKTQIRTYAEGTYNLWNWPDETFPINADSTWPMVGKWFSSGGAEGTAPKAGSVEERLLALYSAGVKESDLMKQADILHEAARIHMEEGPFIIGITGMVPIPVVVKNNLRNVREYGILGPWEVGTPGNLQPEQFFFKS